MFRVFPIIRTRASMSIEVVYCLSVISGSSCRSTICRPSSAFGIICWSPGTLMLNFGHVC